MSIPIITVATSTFPSSYSNTTKYLVPLTKVIFSVPVKVRVSKVKLVVKVLISKTLDVANTAPVGSPSVPNVPV